MGAEGEKLPPVFTGSTQVEESVDGSSEASALGKWKDALSSVKTTQAIYWCEQM